MGKLVSRREYARMRGWQHSYINRLVKEGKLRLVRGKIDPERADADLAVNRTRMPRLSEPAEREPGKIAPLVQAKTIHETYRAKTAKIEYEKLTGKLVDAERVVEVAERAFSNVRNRLRAVPRTIAPLLLNRSNPAEIEEVMLRAIDAALTSLTVDVFA